MAAEISLQKVILATGNLNYFWAKVRKRKVCRIFVSFKCNKKLRQWVKIKAGQQHYPLFKAVTITLFMNL